jgi:4-oxalocrotonate tautomerase
MAIVTIQISREQQAPHQGRTTRRQKAALIKGVTDLLLAVLNQPTTSVFVVIEEVEREDWGVGGVHVGSYHGHMRPPAPGEQAS